MDFLKKLNHKKTSLQDELENKEDEVERLNTKLISQRKEQEEYGEDSEELEETRKRDVDMKTQLEESKMIEKFLKNKLDEKESNAKNLRWK